MDANSRDKGVYAFGPFRLDPGRRLLFRNAVPVKLWARLFDTLLYLVENHDRLVEHFELEQAVWRGRTVEDGNVAKAVSSLRKALGTEDSAGQMIVTVAGRGYRFGAPVVFEAAASGVVAAEPEVGVEERGGATDVPPTASAWWRSRTYVSVGALAMALAAAAAVWSIRPAQETTQQAAPLHTADAPFAPPPHSVAVMASTNLSGDPGQEYFSDGIASGTSESVARQALAAFDQAIKLDPNVALAHMHRCDALGTVRMTSAIHDLAYMKKLNEDALAECEMAVHWRLILPRRTPTWAMACWTRLIFGVRSRRFRAPWNWRRVTATSWVSTEK